jgi:hypothetical protein
MLEVPVLALHGLPSGVQVAEALSVPLNAGVEARRAFDDRHDDLRPALAFERDYGEAAALHALGMDSVGIVGLVGGGRLVLLAARAQRVQERRDVKGFVAAGRLDTPRKRQASPGAAREHQLVAVEGARAARADSAPVAPGGVRIAVVVALGAVLRQAAVAVRKGFEVTAVDGLKGANIGVTAPSGECWEDR